MWARMEAELTSGVSCAAQLSSASNMLMCAGAGEACPADDSLSGPWAWRSDWALCAAIMAARAAALAWRGGQAGGSGSGGVSSGLGADWLRVGLQL